MDKYKVVEEKIADFFIKKAKQHGGLIENYKLIISFDEKLKYEVYGENNSFHGWHKIQEIFNLNLIEQAFVSYKSVEETIFKTVAKFSVENEATQKQIQLLLMPTQQYFVLKNRQRIKEIKLKEII